MIGNIGPTKHLVCLQQNARYVGRMLDMSGGLALHYGVQSDESFAGALMFRTTPVTNITASVGDAGVGVVVVR